MLVYKITNIENNKSYVGITTRNIERRWYEHKYVPNSCGQLLAKAINKYGEESFVIEHIASAIGNVENLKELEKQLIKQYGTMAPNGYNLTSGGDGVFGFKHSEEQRKRNGDLKRGTKASNVTKEKMRVSHLGNKNHFFGKQHSEEAKRKNAEAHFKGTILAINNALAVVVEMNGPQEMKCAGFNPSNVYGCLNGKQKTHKNFIFKRI